MGKRNKMREEYIESWNLLGLSKFFLKKIDLFGKPINMTIAEDSNFKTNLGGIMTIVVALALLALFISEMITLFTRRNTTATRKQELLNIIDSQEVFELGKDERFKFALSLRIGGVDIIADKSYIDVNIDQISQRWQMVNGVRTAVNTFTPIPLVKCGNAFGEIEKKKAMDLGMDNYY